MHELLLVVLIVLACACGTWCARTWETGTEVGRSKLFGPSVTQHLTVGGDIGASCRDSPDAGR